MEAVRWLGCWKGVWEFFRKEKKEMGQLWFFSQLPVLERWKEKAKLLVFIRRGWGFEMQAQGMTGQ